MKCPVCQDVRMREVDKNGVHIDVCPDCKGVWLDRGELEKLTQSVREVRKEYDDFYEEREKYESRDRTGDRDREKRYGDSQHSGPHYPKKKKTVFDAFGDLFD
ncbi:MAG TPA: zf-TFIIB domain-containing protein [Bacilli bacterium]